MVNMYTYDHGKEKYDLIHIGANKSTYAIFLILNAH